MGLFIKQKKNTKMTRFSKKIQKNKELLHSVLGNRLSGSAAGGDLLTFHYLFLQLL